MFCIFTTRAEKRHLVQEMLTKNVEHVKMKKVRTFGIGQKYICGSGLIDALAVLLKAGIIDENGTILSGQELPDILLRNVDSRCNMNGERGLCALYSLLRLRTAPYSRCGWPPFTVSASMLPRTRVRMS